MRQTTQTMRATEFENVPGLDRYMSQVSQLHDGKLLTASQEKRLARRAQRGDGRARGELVERNLRLVISIAKKHQGQGLHMEDLVQEGNAGLLIAVDKFDPDRGNRFSTYATHWIKQAIGRGIENRARMIRIPVHAELKLDRLRRARERLRATLGRDATDAESAAELGLSVAQVEALDELVGEPQRLEAPTTASAALSGEDGGRAYAEIAADHDQVAEMEQVLLAGVPQQIVEHMLSVLDDRQRHVVCRRHGLPVNYGGGDPQAHSTDHESKLRESKLREIGEEIGTSKERVRQIYKKALKNIRAHAEGLAEHERELAA